MKASDIKELTVEDIQAKLEEEKANYEKLRISHKMAQIENPIQLRYMRKTIARLNTELSRKLTEAK
ncbi:50S ribosomal protein L29 [Weeksellaceae bacterium KMM 9713]|uniref:Large ribosomal subunit protein uL29 n=1 Tax=Profundicola chukchiensis TaxID=2961959 RepID=A0A9X4RVW6_9FLAO|nr:50S ribosomal protein L29 [Profundicola chukchiensis]MDG4946260.1 50S ribosomal protein L29 [Profundicola chukchiensis]MDG4950800.1 50S ribosomal protein L29 [Profundicola chukchiensis]